MSTLICFGYGFSREEKFSDELQIASFYKIKLEHCWITSGLLKSINADNTARHNS
jgi:hypothetical protein